MFVDLELIVRVFDFSVAAAFYMYMYRGQKCFSCRLFCHFHSEKSFGNRKRPARRQNRTEICSIGLAQPTKRSLTTECNDCHKTHTIHSQQCY